MIHPFSLPAFIVFCGFVAIVLGISFYLGKKAQSAKGYYAAHGQIHWFVNGVAFAGDYLSAASFLGICGMIAFFGYDGFLYSIGYLAGWVVALFVIAEPLKRLGKFTFADALDKRFNSQGIKFTAAISTLIVSIFYLIPQMVGAGALVKPLLGFPETAGVILVGVIVVVIVVTAGMVSTTYVQFIKGSLLVIFCLALTIMILRRGLTTDPSYAGTQYHRYEQKPLEKVIAQGEVLPEQGGWKGKPYVRVKNADGSITTWQRSADDKNLVAQAQTIATIHSRTMVNGLEQGTGPDRADLFAVGQISRLPDGASQTGPLGPIQYLTTIQNSQVVLWGSETIAEADGSRTTVYFPKPTPGSAILVPGGSPSFAGVSPNFSPYSACSDFSTAMV